MSHQLLQQLILICHLVACFALIGMVLIQQGKGANMGPAFGSGASNTLFGSRGPASFLMKLTGSIAALFFITSLSLGYLVSAASKAEKGLSVPTSVTNTSSTSATQTKTISVQKSAPASNSDVPSLPQSSGK